MHLVGSRTDIVSPSRKVLLSQPSCGTGVTGRSAHWGNCAARWGDAASGSAGLMGPAAMTNRLHVHWIRVVAVLVDVVVVDPGCAFDVAASP